MYVHHVTAPPGMLNHEDLLSEHSFLSLGPIMGALTVVGISFNSIAVITISKHKCLRSRITLLLASLAVSDGVMSAVGGTMYTVNCFYHRWVFGRSGKILPLF